jgi:hypothetical protein
MPPTLLADRTGLLGTTAGLLSGLPPEAAYGYLAARFLIPVLLIVHATRGATPTQRISLIRDYLTGKQPRRRERPKPRR